MIRVGSAGGGSTVVYSLAQRVELQIWCAVRSQAGERRIKCKFTQITWQQRVCRASARRKVAFHFRLIAHFLSASAGRPRPRSAASGCAHDAFTAFIFTHTHKKDIYTPLKLISHDAEQLRLHQEQEHPGIWTGNFNKPQRHTHTHTLQMSG